MNWRVFISKLEKVLKSNFLYLENVDMSIWGLKKRCFLTVNTQRLLRTLKTFEQKGFELFKPPILVKTVNLNFDYLQFRKTYDSV